MNTEEKSLALAELMGWDVEKSRVFTAEYVVTNCAWMNRCDWGESFLTPYGSGNGSLAQFAAILLKFPEVMARICNYEESLWYWCDDYETSGDSDNHIKPTQANILDEILRMNGRME